MVDEILKKLEQGSSQVFRYADDVAVVIKGNFLKTLRKRMQKALRIIEI